MATVLFAANAIAEPAFFLGDARFLVRVVPGDLFAKFGPRFDTTARIDSIKAGEVEFVAMEGLVDEFNQRWVPPPGYENGPALGEGFIKIGVGLLKRTRITPYRFWDPYPVLSPAATRMVFRDDTRAAFEQVLYGSKALAYRYRKAYVVNPGKQTIEIRYELENLGSSEIKFDQYNHNWLALAPAHAASPWTIRTPLTLGPGSLLHCRMSHGALIFDQVSAEGTYLVSGQKSTPLESLTTVTDGKHAISISCDFPAARFAVFAQGNLIAPEIFARFDVPPGLVVKWRRLYRFETQPPYTGSDADRLWLPRRLIFHD